MSNEEIFKENRALLEMEFASRETDNPSSRYFGTEDTLDIKDIVAVWKEMKRKQYV